MGVLARHVLGEVGVAGQGEFVEVGVASWRRSISPLFHSPKAEYNRA
jgi:hypothetical protein